MTSSANDCYRSRFDAVERIVPRQDPVVYASRPARPPMSEPRILDYGDNGFVLLENLFSAREVACFQEEAQRLWDDAELGDREEAIIEPDSRTLRSLFDVPRFSPVFDRLARDARLVEWARYLLDDEVYLHQSRLNYKPGFEGREFYWHSDFETWHVEDGMPRMRALSISIALDTNRASNGPVMLVPGSHYHFISCAGETPEEHYKKSLRRQEYGVPSQAGLKQLTQGNEIAVITGGAGSALLFDCNTMHGSAGNITPYSRTNLFFVYNAMNNQLQAPFSGQKPRPEYIARRADITALQPVSYREEDYLVRAQYL